MEVEDSEDAIDVGGTVEVVVVWLFWLSEIQPLAIEARSRRISIRPPFFMLPP
ncbi:hypothetical protein [Thermococcus stetteri]|uniref:hypothetical protein n=1 Tax=Thermococcus stetteri TaxID=49900 RepID=UPI001FD85702|nr:hypothetical protein [Thermococcus stetteri]MBP1912315.1 hypothetical protein [Thermococcus stetteri]